VREEEEEVGNPEKFLEEMRMNLVLLLIRKKVVAFE